MPRAPASDNQILRYECPSTRLLFCLFCSIVNTFIEMPNKNLQEAAAQLMFCETTRPTGIYAFGKSLGF